MSEAYSYQCRLMRQDGDFVSYTTTYLPEKFAKEGKKLDLLEDYGGWSRGWVVKDVGHKRRYNDPNNREYLKWQKKLK